ncbi:MAG TPA: peptide deformylase [Mycobacteriales bacterium]|nr:peptide deformylase [Mycobacteriales bacterium]
MVRAGGTVRRIRYLGDPVLRTPTDAVTEFDAALARLIEDMFASMYAAEGAGLAANQIGVSLSVFVYDCADGSERRQSGHVVNPRLVQTGGEPDDGYEGCLSMPELYYPNPRASYAVVEGFDLTGEAITITADGGQLARCMQHETDHLTGMVFFDRLRGRAKRQAMRDALAADWATR